jgi:glycerate 2-kinase
VRADLHALIAAAIRASDARRLTARAIARRRHALPPHIPFRVVAAGKAAAAMLGALQDEYPRRIHAQVVASPETGAGHPEPNDVSVSCGRRALVIAADARRAREPLVVLLSGGASAMLAVPGGGLTLDDKVQATRVLLRSGLPIAALNGIRKHLSAIKGGRLAAAAGRTITFAISDVHAPVDDPAVIGSGPTVADSSTFADALQAVTEAGVLDTLPVAVRDHLARGAEGHGEDTIKPGDPRLTRNEFVVAGTRHDAMEGVVTEARARGYDVACIEPPTLGEARVAARAFVAAARQHSTSSSSPVCVVASGETTVRIGPVAGVGGRNQEFALAVAEDLASLGACAVASVGTDGIDGPTEAAGAIVDSTTMTRARALGLDLAAALQAHDSYAFFRALGDLVVTGPTGTNVGDVQIFLSRET